VRRVALGLGIGALCAAACAPGGPTIGPEDSLPDSIASVVEAGVLRLGAGTYQGPIVIDRPIELIGEPGAMVVAPTDQPALVIESDDVTIRDLAIEGGSSGVHVIDSVDVELDDIDVSGAQWHGFLVDNSNVTVTHCHVSGLLEQLSQGFEIRNSIGRPASRVEGCVIEGPVNEGIVAHVSRVTFADNLVTGSVGLGINVTEMSDGRMEHNTVSDAKGAAYFCGDGSSCSVVGNVAENIGIAEPVHTSGLGHGVVVHAMSRAYVDANVTSGLAGQPVVVMLQGQLSDESLYP
jgi:Periplasmic copper-binding protein (NosD)